METYPGYWCPNCGGRTNMMGTGHWGPGMSYLCQRAETERLVPLMHYDLGPRLSVDWDAKLKRFEKHSLDARGRLVKTPISERQAVAVLVGALDARELKRLGVKIPGDLPDSLAVEAAARAEEELRHPRYARERLSPLAG